jgi:hypothetical protein
VLTHTGVPSRRAPRRSYAGDVGGEEVDAVAVEVAAGAVVVLGGPWVGVPGEDLCVAERYAGVEGVGVVPPESWRVCLCRFPVGNGVLVVDRAHHAGGLVPAVVVVEPVVPVQHDGLTVRSAGGGVSGQDLPLQGREERLGGGIVENISG